MAAFTGSELSGIEILQSSHPPAGRTASVMFILVTNRVASNTETDRAQDKFFWVFRIFDDSSAVAVITGDLFDGCDRNEFVSISFNPFHLHD